MKKKHVATKALLKIEQDGKNSLKKNAKIYIKAKKLR
jgi:hypothetical protein